MITKQMIHKKPLLHQSSGVALILALFIVSIVAIITYSMMMRLTRDTAHTQWLLHDIQAMLYANGDVAWAQTELSRHYDMRQPNTPIDRMPLTLPIQHVGGYTIKSTLYDLQGRFNINNILRPEGWIIFSRLVQAVEPKLSLEAINELRHVLIDWIMPNIGYSLYEKIYYLKQPIPYCVAHHPFVILNELRLLKGMTPALFEHLSPYLAALPPSTLINIQSASAPILFALNLAPNLATAKNMALEFAHHPPISLNNIPEAIRNECTLSSDYFLLETIISIDQQEIVLYTLLKRSVVNQHAYVTQLWQTRGVL